MELPKVVRKSVKHRDKIERLEALNKVELTKVIKVEKVWVESVSKNTCLLTHNGSVEFDSIEKLELYGILISIFLFLFTLNKNKVKLWTHHSPL